MTKKILAIDTSCDDTAVAVLETAGNKKIILSDIVSSQVKLHAEYGGVYPMLAKREHQKNLVLVLEEALKDAGLLKARSAGAPERRNYGTKSKTLEKIMGREEILRPELLGFLHNYE
ncbi:MAG: hypothetical protein PHU56_02190, partial [Candidatus Pacebacteria bacterium]|nr:hypothetical protein [Candidatus Paceibacterota bacterium]